MTELEKLTESAKKFPSLLNLTGKTALVVGGNKGLGQAMALGLAGVGADVCVVGRGPAGLAETADAVTRLGRKGLGIAADVAHEEQVEAMVRRVVETYGRIDILVNSQGTVNLEPTENCDMEKWQRVMDVNVKSLVLTCKHAGRVMLSQGKGKIINVSSVRGFQGRAGDVAYAPSKGAVNQLTRSLAIEWGPKGINVNAIAPCFIRTEMNAPIFENPERRAWIDSRSPMGKLGVLEDMFGPVVFLASDMSGFVNGHVLMVDGGWTIA